MIDHTVIMVNLDKTIVEGELEIKLSHSIEESHLEISPNIETGKISN